MEYIIFYGIPLFILITTIVIFKKAESPKMKTKNLSFIMIGVGVNLLVSPVAVFIGTMATDSPDSTAFDFWKGFLFVQAIPLLILFVAFVQWCIGKR